MQLQESAEMYLETIYVLTKQKGFVRSIDVAEHMGFSKPSVSRAVGLLRQGGYINVSEDGSLLLTDSGYDAAVKIFERHTVLSGLLQRLGVSAECAADDACRIEHVISSESFEAIKSWLEAQK